MKTGTQAWEELKTIIQAKVSEAKLLLHEANSNADQTFKDRLAKVHRSDVLRDMLRKSRDDLRSNYTAASNQLDFLLTILQRHDASLREAVSNVRKHVGTGSDSLSQATVELAEQAEWEQSSRISAVTAKIALEGLVLAAVLAGLAGHKEAVAFVEGAKKELIGAIGDPGAGVFMLLKRAHAVATRTLRSDQDADEMLGSLEEFQKLMRQWRQVGVLISEDHALDTALAQALTT